MRMARTKLTSATTHLHQIATCPMGMLASPDPATLYAAQLIIAAGTVSGHALKQPGET